MGSNHLPMSGTLQVPTTVVTTSYVSRVTLLEEAIILICIVLLVTALLRRGPRRIHLLLWGFILIPARDVVFHASITLGLARGGMGAANTASFVSLAGWLLVAGYCLALLWTPSADSATAAESLPREDRPVS